MCWNNTVEFQGYIDICHVRLLGSVVCLIYQMYVWMEVCSTVAVSQMVRATLRMAVRYLTMTWMKNL